MAAEQGGQQGGGQYSEEDVEALLNETARRAAAEALKNAPRPREEQQSVDEDLGMSSKLVKQLQTTVSVFNTLKEFSSNPLQKAIESKVGDLAAGVIEQAFTRPSGPPPKRDIIDTFLNSQLGFGLGQGLGQKGPEFIESIGRLFGKEKAEQMIDNVIGKYGSGKADQAGHDRQGSGSDSDQLAPSAPAPTGPDSSKQSEKEILLSLDPNNPEHVAAYAETQGGISVDVARKMLMIHQDEFIKQMKTQGADVDGLSKIRGSHIDKAPTPQAPAQAEPTHHESNMGQDIYEPPQQPEYAEFRDVSQGVQGHVDQHATESRSEQSTQQGDVNPQLRQFTEDIGKIMGDMVGKIESMNNTIFILQNELNEIKSGHTQTTPIGVQSPYPTGVQSPIGQSTIVNQPIDRMSRPLEEPIDESINQPVDEPIEYSQEPLEEPGSIPKVSAGFFDEHVQDAGDFRRELEEEAKVGARRLEEAKARELEARKRDEQHHIEPIQSSTIEPIQSQSSTIEPIQSQSSTIAHVNQTLPQIVQQPENIESHIESHDQHMGGSQSGVKDNQSVGKDIKESDILPGSNIQSDGSNIQNEYKDITKIESKEIKKYVRPIRKVNAHKNIITPSFKDKEAKRGE